MPDTSPRLALPYILPAQAQKHVTHNTALARLDTATQLVIAAFDAVTPPIGAPIGSVYALGASPGGDWTGQSGALAINSEDGWQFETPLLGWRAWDMGSDSLQVLTATGWGPVSGAAPDFDNLDGVGINATSDATNRLSVSADATLLNHDGTGHQVKVNKATSSDTASLMFQAGFSGRAEMGLAGTDAFSVKVSPDGAAWKTTAAADAATGVLNLPFGIDSVQLTIPLGTAVSVPSPTAGGFVLVSLVHPTSPLVEANAIYTFDTGAGPALKTVWAGSLMSNAGSTALTGTTGTAGQISVSAVAGGSLHIENRYATDQTRYCLTFINGYRII